jgi:streptogramin lyase
MIVMPAAALALVLAPMLLSSRRDGPGAPPKTVVIEGNSLVAIDALTNAVLGEVELGGRPSGVAATEGDVWVGNRDDETLLRIDARTRRVVRRIGLGVEPTELAIGAGSVWVLSAAANAVLEVDPAIGQVVDTIALEEPDALCCSYQLLFFRGALWITASGYLTGSVTRVVPTTHARITTDARKVRSLASDGRTLWGITGFEPERIERLDRRAAPIRVDRLGKTEGLVGVAAGAGALWTVTPDGTLAKIDQRLGRVIVSVPLRHRVAGVAATDRAVWVVTKDGSVLRIDPATARLATSIPLGIVTPSLWGTIAVTDEAVWIATESTLDP